MEWTWFAEQVTTPLHKCSGFLGHA